MASGYDIQCFLTRSFSSIPPSPGHSILNLPCGPSIGGHPKENIPFLLIRYWQCIEGPTAVGKGAMEHTYILSPSLRRPCTVPKEQQPNGKAPVSLRHGSHLTPPPPLPAEPTVPCNMRGERVFSLLGEGVPIPYPPIPCGLLSLPRPLLLPAQTHLSYILLHPISPSHPIPSALNVSCPSRWCQLIGGRTVYHP